MRVAALYDIHGNLPALEAVLQDLPRASVDRIVVGGDVVVGPMTREVVSLLLSLRMPVQFIQGNAEVAALSEMAGTAPVQPLPEPHRGLVRWTAEQLGGFEETLASWPKTLRLDVPGIGEVLFCHATPRDENEIVLCTTPDDVLRPIFEAANAPLVVCGHTHMQFDRTVGRVRVVNAGSVGMPFGPPGAYWLLLGPGVELRHTSYDLTSAAARIRGTAYPHAEEFAAGNVLQPPSEARMLEILEPVALK